MNLVSPHLDGEAEDLNAHAAHIRWGHLSHQSGKSVSVLVNLLNSQGAWKGGNSS